MSIEEFVLDKVRTKAKAKNKNIDVNLDMRLCEDLYLDSLDATEIILDIEEEYNIEFKTEDIRSMKKVSDIITFIEKLVN